MVIEFLLFELLKSFQSGEWPHLELLIDGKPKMNCPATENNNEREEAVHGHLDLIANKQISDEE